MGGRRVGHVAVAALALAVSLPGDGAAQRRGGGADDRGSPAVSLEVGTMGGTFAGVWARLGDRASLGVETSLLWSGNEIEDPNGGERTFTSSRLGLGPSLKLYLDDGSVAPFLYGHAGLVRVESEAETPAGELESTTNEVVARFAGGLEWFASSRFSVAGNVGLRWRSWEEEQAVSAGGERDLDRRALDLFTSGVSVTFHF